LGGDSAISRDRFSWAEKSDQDILDYATQSVDDRIGEYEEAEENRQGFISFIGCLAFGTVDEPRDEQIKKGVTFYRDLRTHQQQVKTAIEELQQAQRISP
jgi:hypothetical protein